MHVPVIKLDENENMVDYRYLSAMNNDAYNLGGIIQAYKTADQATIQD